MVYTLGRRSRQELVGVHPDLVGIVEYAIELTEQDFSVLDGLRTLDEQREYFERGASWTMDSKHLCQTDGHGHAVDLVPYINGRVRWEWPPIYKVAAAVRQAATELDVQIRWGGCWGTLTSTTVNPEILKVEYAARRRLSGRRVTLDGPHFELEV